MKITIETTVAASIEEVWHTTSATADISNR